MKVYESPEGYIEKLRQDAMKEGRRPIPVLLDIGGGLFISAEVPLPGPKNPNESEADYNARVARCDRARKDIEEARAGGGELGQEFSELTQLDERGAWVALEIVLGQSAQADELGVVFRQEVEVQRNGAPASISHLRSE